MAGTEPQDPHPDMWAPRGAMGPFGLTRRINYPIKQPRSRRVTADKRSLDGCRLHLKLSPHLKRIARARTRRRSRSRAPPSSPRRRRRRSPRAISYAMGDTSAADAPAASRFGRICVFCGSNPGNRAVFGDAALGLGKELVARGIDLVYGGGSVGLMGLIAQTVLDGGCSVLGVIPRALMPLEISGASVGEVKVVSDMHERKAEMARQADAFIALPGGYGTMEELLEMITWSQLGIHDKPVGLLNVDGYYDPLLMLFDKGATEGFIKQDCRDIIVSAPTAHELLKKMEQYTRSHQEVAPRTSWEMSELGYGKAPES